MADTTGMADLRAENVSRVVVGFALQEYKLKQLCIVTPSNSWTESYYQEGATELTGGTGSDIKGIPRLAKFPHLEPNWTLVQSRLEKYGGEGVISYEDERTNAVDVIARTLLRIARAVTKSVDDEIYNRITTDNGQTDAIDVGSEWNATVIANRDPIQDILDGVALITIQNYDPLAGNGFLLINGLDFAALLGNANVRNAGQFWTNDVTRNGLVGRLLGLSVINSNSVDADECAIVIAKEALTWKAAVPLTVVTIPDPGIKTTIRAWEIGVTQAINPNAICIITNTAK